MSKKQRHPQDDKYRLPAAALTGILSGGVRALVEWYLRHFMSS